MKAAAVAATKDFLRTGIVLIGTSKVNGLSFLQVHIIRYGMVEILQNLNATKKSPFHVDFKFLWFGRRILIAKSRIS
ncbi:hypothetical protein ACJX0J_041227, partial [Zea mays]